MEPHLVCAKWAAMAEEKPLVSCLNEELQLPGDLAWSFLERWPCGRIFESDASEQDPGSQEIADEGGPIFEGDADGSWRVTWSGQNASLDPVLLQVEITMLRKDDVRSKPLVGPLRGSRLEEETAERARRAKRHRLLPAQEGDFVRVGHDRRPGLFAQRRCASCMIDVPMSDDDQAHIAQSPSQRFESSLKLREAVR